MRQAVAKAVVDAAAEAAAAEFSFKWCVDELEARLAQAITAKDELEAAAAKKAEEAAAMKNAEEAAAVKMAEEAAAVKMAEEAAAVKKAEEAAAVKKAEAAAAVKKAKEAAAAKKAEEAAAMKNAEEAAAVKKAEEAAAAKTAEATALVHDASDPRYKRRHRFVQASPYCPYHRMASRRSWCACVSRRHLFSGVLCWFRLALWLFGTSPGAALRFVSCTHYQSRRRCTHHCRCTRRIATADRCAGRMALFVCLFVCLSVLAGIVVFE
jgi:hypothetical protein